MITELVKDNRHIILISLQIAPVSLCLCCTASTLTHAMTSWETPLKSDEQYFCNVHTRCHLLASDFNTVVLIKLLELKFLRSSEIVTSREKA